MRSRVRGGIGVKRDEGRGRPLLVFLPGHLWCRRELEHESRSISVL